MTSRYHPRHRGFTLVEMLTVVAIIALLISILVPSLARARNQAKKAASAAAVSAISTGLEMFHNAMDDYPDSASIDDSGGDLEDPIDDYFNSTGENRLSGAHWLARALVGHDLQGVDSEGLTAKGVPTGTAYLDTAQLQTVDREQPFLENSKIVVPDKSPKFRTGGDFKLTGRPVLVDSWDSPILYYKANPRRQFPWTAAGNIGVYNMPDNELITGNSQRSVAGWDFALASGGQDPIHPLGVFTSEPADDPFHIDNLHKPIPDRKGQTFIGYLHDHAAGHAGGVVKAVKSDSFILIAPGEDRLFGTMDDVNNFK